MDASPQIAPPSSSARTQEAAFRILFERELDYVCHSLRRLGVSPGDIPDAAQEVFLAIHDRFSDFDPNRPARPWLFAFARGYASNHRKLARHQREVFGASTAAHPTKTPDPEQSADMSERREQLIAALSRVDFDKRVAFIMHDLDGVTVPEIARELSISENTIYSRLRLARNELRALLLPLREETS